MEEIGERVLNAVPERPLPETREEYWQTVWDYRREEFDFFMSNAPLGRVLILSLDRHKSDDRDADIMRPPLAKLIERQKSLIRRGQELGAVRGDLSGDTIFELMKTTDRILCERFFGRDAEEIEKMSAEKKSELTREYTRLFKDLIRRMLEPEIYLNIRDIKEESINVGEIAFGAQ